MIGRPLPPLKYCEIVADTTVAESGHITSMSSIQQIILCWRMGSDSSVSGEGWRMDNVAISQSLTLCRGRASALATPASDAATASHGAVM
jgi:hypothetical protein